jgi:hypothetical protein
LKFLEHVAVQRASALLTGIAVAARAAEGESTDAAETIHSVLVQRDDAECVRAVLPLESRAVVSAALERADATAVSQLSSLSAYAWPDDERLRAVLRREPDAWWGRFAEP